MNENVTLIGGVCRKIRIFNSEKEVRMRGALGIVLSGVQSELMIHDTDNVETLRNKLKEMKSNMFAKRNGEQLNLDRSIILMVSCDGRGKHYYKGKENVECNVINECFPGIRVFGLFSQGELAYHKKLNSDSCCYSYTSIFCLVCY